ncbi:MAG TPA: acetyl-CoA acetyltransferase [Ilumatobacteraceae bacterium]|nr:acetyl-CoA acetyltransferase [Ilumatobacteraceae bacterium]
MSRTRDRSPVIVGIGLSDAPIAPHLSAEEHHAQALQRALADCGMAKADIDGYASAAIVGGDAVAMAEYLGIDHRWIDGTMTGGSAFEFHVQHAAAAIRDGVCDTVLITYGSDYFTRLGRALGTGHGAAASTLTGPAMFHTPYGLSLVGAYAMVAQRHMHQYGTTSEQLAEIAVGVREFAGLNSHAQYRDPITVADVLASRMIADPLHKLDCCVVSDGGGAVIMTTAERAADLRQPGVHVLAAGGAQTHWNISQMPDLTTSAAARFVDTLYATAGVTPADIDTIQLYDSFTITVLLLLEDLGFCPKGEGGRFVEEGHLRRGGRLPMNTDGGGLSASHSGMRGIFLIIEAVRQLRGQAGDMQVPNCEVALAAGSGGWLSAIGAVILGKEAG